jgi:hypothetical protein
MIDQVESIVLKEINMEKFNKNIISNLDTDDFYEGCNTNFRDVLVETLIYEIAKITEKDEWCLQSFNNDRSKKLFDAFMKNSQIVIGLHKRIDGLNYAYKEITIGFDFSENEKRKLQKYI